MDHQPQRTLTVRALTTLLGALTVSLSGAPGDWPVYGYDASATRYSPLKQINTSNVARLQRAWTFHSGKHGSEAIPIVVGGVMYVTAPNGIFALEPETGKQIWHFPAEQVALRGLAYWPGDKKTHARVFAGVRGGMIALDVTTGRPAAGFAREGLLDLSQGVLDPGLRGRVSLRSPPTVYGNIVITGSVNGEGAPSHGAYGDVRGWDAYTGRLLWTFHTVPRPGERGNDTWPEGAWQSRSGTNAWGFLTLDLNRGIVYIPLGAPTSDFYGADRHGDNLYGNSLVALDGATGKLKWYRQLVRHDLWDFDLAAPPILFDAVLKGRTVPAVAEITKMGLLFVFDRVTGDPLYGMEERPVPQSSVPGEKTAATQPFPLKPPPLSRTTFTEQDIYDLTPEHAAYCRDLYTRNRMKIGPLYAPLGVAENVLTFPSTMGGGNWGGLSLDPALGLLFTNVNNLGQWGRMVKKADLTTGKVTYDRTSEHGPYARFWNRETHVPCSKPPFGELVAVNITTGEIAWQVPLGTAPALEALGLRNTGTLNQGGPIGTAGGLVFIAATNDARFRAFESRTGRLLWEQPIDANGHSIPITYMGKDGKQYVALTAANGGGKFGGAPGDAVVAFALGTDEAPRPTSAAPAPVRSARTARPIVLPEGAGKARLQQACGSSCHKLDAVIGVRRTREQWVATVDYMISLGARANRDERNQLIDYLVRHCGR
jgi:quinoprotein glucose dehydrogenase